MVGSDSVVARSARLVRNIGLDELSELRQRFLPAQVARFRGNHVRHAFLHHVQLCSDRSFFERDCYVHLAGQVSNRSGDTGLLVARAKRVPGGDIALPTDGWNVVLPIAIAQVLAVRWSDALGLPVDDPFAGLGTLSRVVSGVRLYPVTP